ncbi:DUF927 domain-containing protein [Carnobacterium maltaromaticum]|uniref:DUF927 domain-containing protein n=1 Tax=Carnobacterium maltaromaticum TaxID=2751 RepID=A0AAW9KCK7_CARML|nr:DUF927 domain-containing protein [Carnobacterium maltaromaticum]MDZ5759853.1 DUF927 domain-containing protein [Carnobacterium maltaromaticum]
MSLPNKYSIKNLKKLKDGEFIRIGESEYQLNQKGIFKTNQKGQLTPLSMKLVTIEKSYLNALDELEYELAYQFQKKIKKIRITHSQIQPNKIGLLANRGVMLNQKENRDLSTALALLGGDLEVSQLSNQLGFVEIDDELHFRGVAEKDLLTSELGAAFNIEKKGTLSSELLSIKTLIRGGSELELVYSLGFTSIVNYYLRKQLGIDTLQVLYFLMGDSSSGKTTALQAALSPFGCPDPRAIGSFVQTFSSTDNALIKQISNLNGYTLGVDDLGAAKEKSKADFCYILGNGKEKSRSNSDGSLIPGSGFEASVIGTGEFSIRDTLTNHGGQQLRCIEFKELAYTTSQKHSEEIKSTFLKNYGNMASEFATKLIGLDLDKLKSLFDDSFNLFLTYSEVTQTNKLQRYSKQLAVILLSVKLLNKFFSLEFDEKEITRLILNNLKETEEWLDYAQVAFGKLVSWILEHENQFGIDRKKARNVTNSTYGYIKNEPNLKKVFIESKTFKNVADEIGLPDLIPFIKQLKQKGLVETDKDRSTKKIGSVRYYVFILK